MCLLKTCLPWSSWCHKLLDSFRLKTRAASSHLILKRLAKCYIEEWKGLMSWVYVHAHSISSFYQSLTYCIMQHMVEIPSIRRLPRLQLQTVMYRTWNTCSCKVNQSCILVPVYALLPEIWGNTLHNCLRNQCFPPLQQMPLWWCRFWQSGLRIGGQFPHTYHSNLWEHCIL